MNVAIKMLKENLLTYLYMETAGANIFVNTDFKGVNAPVELKGMVQFFVSQKSVPKLGYEDEGIVAPMVFNTIPTECFFPWDSIISVQSTDGTLAIIHKSAEEVSTEEIKEKEPELSTNSEEIKNSDNVISVDFKRGKVLR